MCYKLFKILVIISISLFGYTSSSQEIPPINIFSTEIYGAENQNWAISQGTNKFIYVANNEGLLEYNGANWQLYATPNETIMRSVKSFEDKIYTGFYMDFGYWKRNDFGLLEYASIVKEQKIKMLQDEQIWEIFELDGYIIFKSLERIYLFNLKTNTIKIINAERKILKLSIVDGIIYFQENTKGIYRIENGVPKLVSDDVILKENKVVDIFLKDQKLLFLTQKNGFFFLENNQIKPWKIPSNNFLLDKTIYSANHLKNGSIVIGTISDGLIYLTKEGKLNYQVTQALGLSNNTVLSIFEDLDSNIWLGLDNGINTINLTSPFKLYEKKNNFWGTIYASIVFNDYLYLGTNQGLYYRKKDTEDTFQFVNNTQGQVWDLEEIDNTLFCSHDSGTFIVKNKDAQLIEGVEGTWGVKKITNTTILQGNYDGLYVLEKVGSSWKLRNKIKGFYNSSKYFILEKDNKIFVNHEYNGVFKLEVDKDFTKVLKVNKDESVEKGIHSSLIKYHKDIFYSSKKGVFRYDVAKNKFKLDTIYSKLIPQDKFLSAKLLFDKMSNKLWSFTKEDIRYFTPGKLSSKPSLEIIPIKGSVHKGASGYENIIYLSDKKYLIGTSDGYLIVNLNNIKEPNTFKVSINKVFNHEFDAPKSRLSLSKSDTFKSYKNNFEFFYSVPNYNKTSSIKYQYQLDGLNEKWSKLSNSSSLLFENLPHGDYIFKVRASIDNKLSNNVAEYSFKIDKPWYVNNFMVTLYIFLFIYLAYLVNDLHRKYYRNQREKLLEKAQKELELQELESSQKIIKLNNEKLRNDIEGKNRELATSTMSIIRKNEFLSSIKTELVSGGKENLNKVVKIIDKNLNNTDDWKMFQEAFNNADKKFLDKIKSKHPELTPNDLRLCAYLRLNLSSKEIAPLLNISPRSVEVKRYRLRKKMNLPHDENLTSYIIEV
ncbi:helix-turn-helix and ligand-binding sensor domain-containing protein [Polaribacter glomeratus]|uniref:LuxR family transcriptional regulator n=1 Tax=Polaribacter glomeratus TaxID=102 RepID=A0A2S7WW80_9FLAO|nr:triple tyrosine motif-containing protein [Polaribacter glomeratus]PQJ81532.1 LuxR family transcriptional regulator [Polaribacter glomeratus]TXD64636.1 LuxR family transcriptional regulator [Polaribacter glomeratus]